MTVKMAFSLNGVHTEADVDPAITLLELLRGPLQKTGTKHGCGKGECGACTVILNGKAVNSCIVPVLKAKDAEVFTVEGLKQGDRLHPLQQAFIDKGAVQCGFCTPGMLMSAKALLDANPEPDSSEIRAAIGGNICRCTGYVKIEEAIVSAAEMMRAGEV